MKGRAPGEYALISLSSPAGRRGPGRGGGSLDFGRDGLEHAGKVISYVIVPEANHPVALCVQGTRARGVLIDGLGMLTAIDLYNELAGRNGEVRNVPPNRMLTPDFDRKPHGTQRPPQRSLHLRRVPAQRPRSACPWLNHPTSP